MTAQSIRSSLVVSIVAGLFMVCPVSEAATPQFPHGTRPATPAARSVYGWTFVDLPSTFGTHATISGLTTDAAGLHVVATQFTPTSDTYGSAVWHADGTLGPSRPVKPMPGYNGSFHLTWANRSNSQDMYGVQHASITRNGKTVVHWPKSVIVYGEPSQIEASGAVDNQILGRSGNWLWIALKGPAIPPVKLPIPFRFRNWNRVMAINLQSGQDQVYHLPKLTSPVDASMITPAFTVFQGKVYIAVSDWMGVFPGNPASIQESQTARILRPVPAATDKARLMMSQTELASLVQQEAGSIAYFWDQVVMKTKIKGTSGDSTGWLSDGAYINHGAIPFGIVYGAFFPLKSGSADAKRRQQWLSDLVQIARNPLTTAAYVYTTPQKIRQHFGGEAPIALPGYEIQHGLYVPNHSAWPLPNGYRSYADVFSKLGPRLAQLSPFAVWIPGPAAIGDLGKYWADVNYTVNSNEYDLNVYAGSKLPANSKSIVTGDANLLFNLHAQSASKPLGQAYVWDMDVKPKNAKTSVVSLGHGMRGTFYQQPAKGNLPGQETLVWKEKGWDWRILVPSGYPNQGSVREARRQVSVIRTMDLPTASGEGIFSFGSDAPSQVVFTWGNAKYVLYANGWQAPAMASTLVDLSAY